MADHPSTFGGESLRTGKYAWDDRASIHAADDGEGLFDGAKALTRGTFADMIRHLASLPEEERQGYVIEKAGDRRYSPAEAMALASHPDFPAKGGS